MNEVAKEFVLECIAESQIGFSNSVNDAYTQVINWMSQQPHMAGFDKLAQRPDLEDDSPYGTARQFLWYFQTHKSKAFNSLLYLANLSLARKETCWLDTPNLHVIDIGAGTGAATIALLDLLCVYQDYRWSHGYTVWPRHISIVAVEPNRNASDILLRFCKRLRTRVEMSQIEFEITIIREEYPQPALTDKISSLPSPLEPCTLLFVLSNVELWIRYFTDKISRYLQAIGSSRDVDLGAAEAVAIEKILDHYGAQRFWIVDIVTRGKVPRGIPLIDSLVNKIRGFFRRLQQEPSKYDTWSHKSAERIEFINCPSSYFGKRDRDSHSSSDYFHAFRAGNFRKEISDPILIITTKSKNLELAWVRTRNHMYYDDLFDDVEIRLMDFAWETRLERIKVYLEAGIYSLIDISQGLAYSGPKNDQEDRPRYILRFVEQIVSAALSQFDQRAFISSDKNNVFGNRLNQKKNEFFYDPWFQQFEKYISSIRQYKSSSKQLMVRKIDIASYYSSILQYLLYKMLRRKLGLKKGISLRKALNIIVNRELSSPPHKKNQGLPQSGVTAGLWANFYLESIDDLSINRLKPDGDYLRYADDITLVGLSSEIDSLTKEIEVKLESSLGLTLNHSKTLTLPLEEYSKSAVTDPRFEKLGIRVRRLLNGLYHIPTSYEQARKFNRSLFLREYTHLLKHVDIYLPDYPYWLNRKIRQRTTLRHRLNHFISGLKVNFPSYHTGMTEDEINNWYADFKNHNISWLNEHKLLQGELVDFFDESLNILSNKKKQNKGARSAIRFTTYRLSLLGLTPIIEPIEELLRNNPWIISPKFVLKALVDCGRGDIVLDLAKNWHKREAPIGTDKMVMSCAHSFCASACRALMHENVIDEIDNYLWLVLFDSSSHLVEKLAASEALLKRKTTVIKYKTNLIELIKQSVDEPYLLKNLILLIASDKERDNELLLFETSKLSDHFIVHDAVQFALLANKNIFDIDEPSIVESYYSSWYPDLPIKMPYSPQS